MLYYINIQNNDIDLPLLIKKLFKSEKISRKTCKHPT